MPEHNLLLFALSTCIHCKHAKEFLNTHSIKYDLIHVDLVKDFEQEAVMEEVMKYNPSLSFPTLVVDHGKKVIVGFKQAEYMELTNA